MMSKLRILIGKDGNLHVIHTVAQWLPVSSQTIPVTAIKFPNIAATESAPVQFGLPDLDFFSGRR
jgi:hypothetical protein